MFYNQINIPFIDNFDISPKLISAGLENHDLRNMVRAMHMHADRVEILLMQTGTGIHSINGQNYNTQKGDLIIYNSGILHDECPDSKEDISVLSCSIELKIKDFPVNTLHKSTHCPIIHSGDRYHELEHLMLMIYHYSQIHTDHSAQILHYYLRTLILIIIDLYTVHNPVKEHEKEHELACKIKTFIDKNYLDEISLDIISNSLCVSQYHLVRIFKKATGYSPGQYIIRRRIGSAQSLLLNTKLNITDISLKVGYSNPNYFTNAFVKVVGTSPKKYRKLWSDT